MSIGYIKQSAASVPTPPVGEQNTFIDSADDKFKKKLDSGTIVDLEGAAAGVSSFEGRTGFVTAQAGDYNASEVTNTPAGGISSITVQAAINELDSEKAPISHVGSGGSQHADATTSVAGFMSASDKTKLDGISPVSELQNQTISSDLTIPSGYNLIRGLTKVSGGAIITIGLNGILKLI